jgi:hypothetical protein
MFLLFFIFLLSTLSFSCPVPRDQLLGCLRALMDKDGDGVVDQATLDSLLLKATCLPKTITDHLSGPVIMQMCDTNKDGSLTMADWTSANGCIQKPNHLYYACMLCQGCGYQFTNSP